MSTYGWIIDKDYDAEPDAPAGSYQNAVGLMGPHDITEDIQAGLALGQGKQFRILYDDPSEPDHIVYEGRILVVSYETDDEDWAPVTDFSHANVGATRIQYWEKHPQTGEYEWRNL
jgi:hypothetical protein